ncbi:uncharacterized protein NPIL_603651 [Nephila pilipes]|uniref:Lipocalin/cytosolic fatty-acid binding domain-containing protein n=1 Tax=Nephila pilipes TaxID=299642 RepID=A0A8X6TTC7_NEPPI|nr:uncharacterized protein NPIL_603651 [Nephila pilipes]
MFVAGVVVLLLSVTVGCYGNSFKMGACPRVTVMEQVDFERFSGDWYVVKRFNPMATCTKLVIEKGSDDAYTINETSRPLGLNFGFPQQYIKARKIKFLRNDTNSIFKVERNFAHFALSTFGIVDTDYTNYAVVWGCDPVLFGSVQNVDIFSRQPTLDKDIIKSAKNNLKEMGIDIQPMDNIDQTHCSTPSSGDGSGSEVDRNTNNIVAG